MNIILVSGRLAKARTIALAAALNYVMLRVAADLHIPYLQTMLLSAQQEQHERSQSYLRENLNAMAVRLGQMQAQLVRLDKLAGFNPQDLVFNEMPGRGGAVSSLPSQDLSLGDFTRQLDSLTRQVE